MITLKFNGGGRRGLKAEPCNEAAKLGMDVVDFELAVAVEWAGKESKE